jgi:repressor LexA
MKEPTKRQEAVLTFIAEYIRKHTYPPTIREIADKFTISVKGAHDHVTALKKKGLIRQEDKRSRTMELVREGNEENEFLEIDILGTVAAGEPILSEENMDGSIKLPKSLFTKNKDYFALRVRGDSMQGVGIMNGDTVVIEKQDTVKNGEITVVKLGEEAATLKTFYRESTRIRLQPENPKYSPKYCSSDEDVRVLGRVVQVLRSYNSGLDA